MGYTNQAGALGLFGAHYIWGPFGIPFIWGPFGVYCYLFGAHWDPFGGHSIWGPILALAAIPFRGEYGTRAD